MTSYEATARVRICTLSLRSYKPNSDVYSGTGTRDLGCNHTHYGVDWVNQGPDTPGYCNINLYCLVLQHVELVTS
jgi:hypothetical protein